MRETKKKDGSRFAVEQSASETQAAYGRKTHSSLSEIDIVFIYL